MLLLSLIDCNVTHPTNIFSFSVEDDTGKTAQSDHEDPALEWLTFFVLKTFERGRISALFLTIQSRESTAFTHEQVILISYHIIYIRKR
jgi:hypothetical protein